MIVFISGRGIFFSPVKRDVFLTHFVHVICSADFFKYRILLQLYVRTFKTVGATEQTGCYSNNNPEEKNLSGKVVQVVL